VISKKKLGSAFGVASIAILAILCAGCGSSSNHNITQAQAQAISHEIATAVDNALSSAGGGSATAERAGHSALARVISNIHPDQLPGCTVTGTGETCNVPISYSGPCPDGGTISVSGDFSFTLDSSGDGKNTESLTVTPTNCGVESNLTVNGDPNIGLTTAISVTDYAIVYPVTLTETGGITYGPNPSGSCTLDVTDTVTPPTTCTVSGTLCGQTLSGSC